MDVTLPAPTDRAERFNAVFAEVYEPLQRYVRRRCAPDRRRRRRCRHPARRVATARRRAGGSRAALVLRRRATLPRQPRSYGESRPATGASAGRRATARTAPAHRRSRPGSSPRHPVADRSRGVRLWAWEGLAPREIAAALDLTPNAVSIRLHRARSKLALKLGKEHRDAGHQHEPVETPSDARREGSR